MDLNNSRSGAAVEEKRQTLDYARPKEKQEIPLPVELDDFVRGLSAGRLRSKWFYYQLAYYVSLGLLLWVIGWRLGPNVYNFKRLTRPTPADFVSDARDNFAPYVRAMKEFERDRGRLPNDARELVPRYLASEPYSFDVTIWQGGFRARSKWHQAVIYDFAPGSEGWYVIGGFTNGKIPLPPVRLPPATRPTTQSN